MTDEEAVVKRVAEQYAAAEEDENAMAAEADAAYDRRGG